MFRCENCEDFFDKSEARENPEDDCSSICEECLAEYEEDSLIPRDIEYTNVHMGRG